MGVSVGSRSESQLMAFAFSFSMSMWRNMACSSCNMMCKIFAYVCCTSPAEVVSDIRIGRRAGMERAVFDLRCC